MNDYEKKRMIKIEKNWIKWFLSIRPEGASNLMNGDQSMLLFISLFPSSPSDRLSLCVLPDQNVLFVRWLVSFPSFPEL